METADLSHHISRRFNEDLERVRNKVLAMGGMVEQQLANAVTALIEGDSNLGVSVARDDFKVTGMEVSIDEECSRILATRSPAAGASYWPVTVTISDWPSSSMAREPTRAVPACTNQPLAGSPSRSIRGSLTW